MTAAPVTMSLDDTTLMAFADGALSAAEAAAVSQAIAQDAALAERVAMLTAGRQLAREALDTQLETPVPDALRAAVEAMAAAHRAKELPAAAAPVPERRKAVGQTERSSWLRWLRDGWANLALPAAMAASAMVALVIHGLASAPVTPTALAVGQPLSPAIASLLDKMPSGAQGPVDGAPLSVIASYRDAAGSLCRDFSLEAAAAAKVEAVACHASTGGWDLRFAHVVARNENGFSPAASGSAVEAYLASIGASEALDQEAEAAALRRPESRP